MPTTDQAICLRTLDYSETSQVVRVLSRGGGVQNLLAKGSKRARSRIGGAMDLFSEGQVVYIAGRAEGTLGTLTEFAETTPHGGLRGDLPRLNAGLYMLELTAALLAEGDPHPAVFDLLHNALARLDQPDASPAAVLAYFQYRILRHAGLLGDLGSCISCGQGGASPPPDKPSPAPPRRPRGEATGLTHFSSSSGGLLCRRCQGQAKDKTPVGGAALAGLAAMLAAEAGRRPLLPDDQARAVNALLAYHAQYQLGKRLATARHLAKPR